MKNNSKNFSKQKHNPDNPNALYEDPSFPDFPQTSWDLFRRFAHGSKRWIYTVVVIAMGGSMLLSFRQGGPASFDQILNGYFARSADSSHHWKYNIERSFVRQEDLVALFSVLADLSPGSEEIKETRPPGAFEQFARDQFETDLLLYAALQEEALKGDEARQYMENAVRHAAAEYYLLSRVPEAIRRIPVRVEDGEVEDIYRKSKEAHARAGIDRQTALSSIRYTLFQTKVARRNQALLREREKILQLLRDRLGPKFISGN